MSLKPLSSFLLAFAALLSADGLVSQEPDAKATPSKPPARVLYRARHILIPWKGSRAATPATTDTEDQARKKAAEIRAKLAEGADFAALAREFSACPSKDQGGYLGYFRPGRMVPAFEEAVAAAKVGEVVVARTPFGYHVIQRMKVESAWPESIDAAHILISFKGARSLGGQVTRSKEEARQLAEKLLAEIKAGEVTFADAAKTYSDDKASGARGGALGVIAPESVIPRIAEALVGMAQNTVGGPVETMFGFHILQRRADPPPPLGAAHVLVPWKGALRAPPDVTRSKKEALALAKEVLKKAQAGEDFAELARMFSSCPSKARGGDLGTFRKGQMIAEFEAAVRKAKVGQIVGPVETLFGYHVIKRTR